TPAASVSAGPCTAGGTAWGGRTWESPRKRHAPGWPPVGVRLQLRSHFPVFLLAGRRQHRPLDGHLDQLHLVLVLRQRLGALRGGPAGGCGRPPPCLPSPPPPG